MTTSFLCVDLQNDFSLPGGECYVPRHSVEFIRGTLFPWMKENGLFCSEIISDYRQPRPGDERDCCRPGEWGYASLLDDDLRYGSSWIKSMNSPVWTRKNKGDPEIEPGEPYPDPGRFNEWLLDHIGPPSRVIIFGLTADCCVLCTVQELRFRGYEPFVLSEATDVRSGSLSEKEMFLSGSPFNFWGEAVAFDDLNDIM